MTIEQYRNVLTPAAFDELQGLSTLPTVTVQIDGEAPRLVIPPNTQLTNLRPLEYPLPFRLEPQTVVYSERQLRDEIARRAETWPSEKIGLLGTSGLPGVGKTSFAAILQEIRARVGRESTHLDDDRCLRTPRNSPLRKSTNLPPSVFDVRYHNEPLLEVVIAALARARGQRVSIESSQLYDRASGEVRPGRIEIPEDKDIKALYWIDGVRSNRRVALAQALYGIPGIKVAIHDRPEAVLKRVVERDARSGRRTREEARTFRKDEFKILEPDVERNAALADVVWVLPDRGQQYSFLSYLAVA